MKEGPTDPALAGSLEFTTGCYAPVSDRRDIAIASSSSFQFRVLPPSTLTLTSDQIDTRTGRNLSATPSSPPPPLSLRVASHPLYNEALQRVLLDLDDKHVSGVWDVGCGPGPDLLEFARRGVPPSKLVGLDLDPGFEAMGRSVATFKGFCHPPYHFFAQDVFSDTLVDPPCRPALIVAYRLFHLHPPSSHLQMLRTLLSLPSSLTKPTYILGLHRALPPSSTSAFYPASSSSQDSDHWLWAADDWGALLREVASDGGYQVGWVWKAGLALERGAVEWWVKSCPPTAAAEGSIR